MAGTGQLGAATAGGHQDEQAMPLSTVQRLSHQIIQLNKIIQQGHTFTELMQPQVESQSVEINHMQRQGAADDGGNGRGHGEQDNDLVDRT